MRLESARVTRKLGFPGRISNSMDVFLALRFGGNAIFRNLYYLPYEHFAGAPVRSKFGRVGFGQFCQGFPVQEKSKKLPQGSGLHVRSVYSSRRSDQSKHVAFLKDIHANEQYIIITAGLETTTNCTRFSSRNNSKMPPRTSARTSATPDQASSPPRQPNNRQSQSPVGRRTRARSQSAELGDNTTTTTTRTGGRRARQGSADSVDSNTSAASSTTGRTRKATRRAVKARSQQLPSGRIQSLLTYFRSVHRCRRQRNGAPSGRRCNRRRVHD